MTRHVLKTTNNIVSIKSEKLIENILLSVFECNQFHGSNNASQTQCLELSTKYANNLNF